MVENMPGRLPAESRRPL